VADKVVPDAPADELDAPDADDELDAADETDESDEEYWEDAPTVPMSWSIFALVLSLLGFGDALYLTIDHFTGTLPVCAAHGIINCAAVTTSKESYLLHIPVALLGLLFFTSMVVVNVPPLWRTRHSWVAWVRLAMVTTGLGMVVYLVSAEVFSIHAICLWCTGVHIITVTMFVFVLATFPTVLAASRARHWEGAEVADGAGAGS